MMDIALFRKALVTLFREAYIGPPDPKTTWFASNAPDAGVLGTLSHVSAAHAHARPAGVSHSIAEHAAHLRFGLRTSERYAKGDFSPADWSTSWNAGPNTEEGWRQLQADLSTVCESLMDYAEKLEDFGDAESITGFMGTVAHGAYHLSAIRQLAHLQKIVLPAAAES